MFVLPFLQPYHRYPLTSFYSEWLAFALGLAAAMLLAHKASWDEAKLPAVALAPIALIVVVGLQATLGRVPYTEQALMAALYLFYFTTKRGFDAGQANLLLLVYVAAGFVAYAREFHVLALP